MKYEPFQIYLAQQSAREIPMTFAEIETLIGQSLPPSARRHRPWWSNAPGNNVMTRIWLDAGYRTARVDMGSERLVFERIQPAPTTPAPTVAVKAPAATSMDILSESYGALRGTVRTLPGVDLTAPTGEAWGADR